MLSITRESEAPVPILSIRTSCEYVFMHVCMYVCMYVYLLTVEVTTKSVSDTQHYKALWEKTPLYDDHFK